MKAARWLDDMSETTKAELPLTIANKPRLDTIPPLLASLRDYLQEVLPLLLRAMFEKADDAFFELAEKAEIAAEQKIYFNAKKEIRLKRRTIETTYLSSMREVFHLKPANDPSDQQNETQKILNDSSIDNPMFRVLSALNDMVDRSSKTLDPLLSKVTLQINMLLPDYKLNKYNSPMSIYTFAEQFLFSCGCLNIEPEEKIILLSMFDKYVLNDLDRVLNRAHRLLLDGEIEHLASSKLEIETKQKTLASNKKNKDDQFREVNKNHSDKRKHLMRQLTALQKESLARIGDFDVKKMNELVCSIAHDLDIENDSAVGVELQQATNLIGMLFNFILSENPSDDLNKWLIQLYLPLLRAVFIDVTVLSRESHAVRRLLNEITKAAALVKLDSSLESDLYRRYISRVIERIIEDFVDDLSIFPELLVDFKAAIDDENKRQKIINNRIKNSNSSIDQLDKARSTVDKKLARLFKGRKVPITVVDFLNQQWSMVMCFLYVEKGEKSIEWNNAIDVAEFVVESVLPENKGGLMYQLPRFLDAISDSMVNIGATPKEISQFLMELEELHLQQYQQTRNRVEKRLASKPTVMPIATTIDVAEESIFESVVPDDLVANESVDNNSSALDEEQILKEQRRKDAQECANSLKADMWLEYFPERDKKVRVKIAAILRPAKKFIFVDRDGKKIVEKTIDEMVDSIEKEELKLLDADSIFGKALSIKRRL